MSARNMSLLENSGEPETDQKNEYLKILNRDLVNEVVILRQSKSQMQSDIDFLLKKNMEAEFKNNEYVQTLSNIDKRSKVCLNKIVECSTELSQIINLAKSLMNIDNRKASETPASSKNNSNTFKQVVTPHAVNGHIIHTPTIRLARYNEPRPQGQNGRIGQEENLEGNGEDTHDSNHEMNEVDPEDETDGRNNESEVPDESEAEESEVSMKLQTIQEESLTPSMMEEQEMPIFSGRCHEVKIYLNQSTAKKSRINNKRGVGGSGDYAPDDSSMRASTIGTPNISDETLSQSHTSERVSGLKSESPKQNSFAKRKSLGSPVPPKIARRSGSFGKPIHSRSPTSPDITSSPESTLKDQSREKIATKRFRRNFEESRCYLNETSIPSTSSVQYNNIEETRSERRVSATMVETLDLSDSVLQNIDTNMDKNSIHSTPLSTQRSSSKSSKKSTGSKITSRRKGQVQSSSRGFSGKELTVKLERSDLDSLQKLIKKSSNSLTGERREDEENAEIELTPHKKIKKEIKIESGSPSKAAIVCERPRRTVKPLGAYQEPSINRKLRRDF